MNAQKRSNLVLGILLIVGGLVFLASRVIPGFELALSFSWPWIIIGVGAALLLLGLLLGSPEMAIPACVVSGVGGILYYQSTSGDWLSWAYAWALIPVFVGIGMILAALIGGRPGKAYLDAFGPIGFGLVAFVLIGSFFNAFSGGWAIYLPLVLVLVGAYILVRNLVRR